MYKHHIFRYISVYFRERFTSNSGRGNVHGFILLHCNGCFMSIALWVFLWKIIQKIWGHFVHWIYLLWLLAIKLIKASESIASKSLSEALIFASTNPQYDKILFTDLPVQHMKTTSPEHILYTNCFCFDIQNNFCTQHVLSL